MARFCSLIRRDSCSSPGSAWPWRTDFQAMFARKSFSTAARAVTCAFRDSNAPYPGVSWGGCELAHKPVRAKVSTPRRCSYPAWCRACPQCWQ
jgi:hypothetical protein